MLNLTEGRAWPTSLDPLNYRTVDTVKRAHQRWFWGSLAAAFVPFFASAWTGPTYWTVFLCGIPLFVAGRSYSRWVGERETVFKPGGIVIVAVYIAVMAFGLLVSTGIGAALDWLAGPYVRSFFHQTVNGPATDGSSPVRSDPPQQQ